MENVQAKILKRCKKANVNEIITFTRNLNYIYMYIYWSHAKFKHILLLLYYKF